MNYWRSLIVLAGLLALAATPAMARVYGNPVSPVKDGEFAVGLSLAGIDRSFEIEGTDTDVFDIDRITARAVLGLSDETALEFFAGTLDIDSLTGTEFGAGYRLNTGPLMEGIESGFMISLLLGTVSDDAQDGNFTQIDAAFGGAYPVGDTGSAAYVNAVVSKVRGTLDAGGTTVDVEDETFLGVAGGFEFATPNGSLHAGGEIHLIFETGFAVYFLLAF